MEHVTTETLARFRELSEAEVLEASRHLRECPACAALAQQEGGEDALLEVRFAFGLGMVEHPESDPDLFDYVAGRLDSEQSELMAVHLRWFPATGMRSYGQDTGPLDLLRVEPSQNVGDHHSVVHFVRVR